VQVPSANEWAYFASKGIKIVRLPFKWERMQNISGPLSPTYLALVKTQLEMATNNSMTVILDCHNFGSGFGSKLNDPAGNVTSAIFADLWTKLATELLGNRAIAGFDIMNEPNNMPSPTAWPDAAQAAITAIRAVDKVTAIYVEGDHWSGAQNWSAQNPLLHTLTDSTCTNKAFGGKPCIVWSAHCYLDRDSSGTHFNVRMCSSA
jgi:endoglucanase